MYYYTVYLNATDGYSGGLTPLLDREGKPVISAVVNGGAGIS